MNNELQSASRGHVARHTIDPDSEQALLQVEAVERYREQEAERISRLPAIAAPSVRNLDNPLEYRPR